MMPSPTPLDLDPLIHERARMGLMSALAGSESLPFAELKEILGLTDGNLSVHAGHLIKAGYVAQTKTFVRNRPHTTYRLTPKGRKAFEEYLETLQRIIDAAGKATN